MKRFTISHLLMLAAIVALLITLFREKKAHHYAESRYTGAISSGLIRFDTMPQSQPEGGVITIAGVIHLPLKMELNDPKVVCSVLSYDGSRITWGMGSLSRSDVNYQFQTHFSPNTPGLSNGLYVAQVEVFNGDKQLVLAIHPLKIVELGKQH